MAVADQPTTASFETATYSGDRLDDGLARWRDLEAHIGSQGWSCSHEWVSAFVRHYGDFASIETVFVTREGEDIGAGLLCQKRLPVLGPLGFQALLNGTGGEPNSDPFFCEHHRLLTRKEHYAAVEQAVTEHALAKPGVDAVYWSGYKREQVASLLDRDSRCEVTSRTYATLTLSAGHLSDANAEARWIDDADDVQPAIESLIAWNRENWGAVGENGYKGRNERLLSDAVPALVGAGKAAVVATPSATVVLFVNESVEESVFVYIDGGANEEALLSAHRAAAALASDRGFKRYDLAVVPADGLDDLTTETAEMLWVRIPQLTWRSRLVFGVSRIKQRLRG